MALKLVLGCLLVLGRSAPTVHAQVVDSIPPEPSCAECDLEIVRTISLGSEDGEGFIDWPEDVSRANDKYLVVNSSLPYEIRAFDSTGTFLGVEGNLGQGPGEYQIIWDLFSLGGETLYVLDIGNQRITTLTPDLEVLDTKRLIGRPTKDGFVALSDGSSILNSAYPDGQGGVALLHRLLETGRRDFSFAGDAKASPVGFSNPEGSLRIPAYSQDPERLFVGRREPIAVEEWTLEGRLVRTVFLPGREWRLERPGGSPGYSAGIQHLRVDGEGRLWVIIRVVDPSWEEAMEEVSHGHRTSQAISDYNRYWDSVVEVWDKEGRSVLARKQFPEFFLGFLESGEVYSYRTTEEAIPFVDIHDLRYTIHGVHQERR